MRVLFFTHYFPPEGNAPASRTYEMCRRWVRAGHEVTVITCAPNAPNGILYEGYRNRLIQSELIGGIRTRRVWTYLAANKGTFLRILNYLTYMVSASVAGLFVKRPDVVIATSPQFFCGWTGVLVSRMKRVPFILEIRDLWPDSIVAVGAITSKRVIDVLEMLEKRMYAAATHIVTVGDGYKAALLDKGIEPRAISVITNGVDRETFFPCPPDEEFRKRYGLGDDFVCAYVGTIGMASGLEVVLRAATILKDRGRRDIRFLLVGGGAVKGDLEREASRQNLDNVTFVGRQSKNVIPKFLSAADACLVHLKRRELFKCVLPSKIFEAAAMARPIILGVEGNAANLVERAGAGICIEPENADQLVAVLVKLADDRGLAASLGQSGHDYVMKHFDREELAADYMNVVRQTCHVGQMSRHRGTVE